MGSDPICLKDVFLPFEGFNRVALGIFKRNVQYADDRICLEIRL